MGEKLTNSESVRNTVGIMAMSFAVGALAGDLGMHGWPSAATGLVVGWFAIMVWGR